MNLTLVLHFNHFSGHLEGGYLMNRETKEMIGKYMAPHEVFLFWSAAPKTRVEPLKI